VDRHVLCAHPRLLAEGRDAEHAKIEIGDGFEQLPAAGRVAHQLIEDVLRGAARVLRRKDQNQAGLPRRHVWRHEVDGLRRVALDPSERELDEQAVWRL
jgi:hypothetical protein